MLFRLREAAYYFVEAARATESRFLWLTVLVYAIAGVLAAWMLAIAIGSLRKPRAPTPIADAALPALTVIVPCYEEEVVLARSVASVTKLDYPADKLQIVYVYDRGKDRTPEALAELARENPGITVAENGGADRSKAGAINWVLRTLATGSVIAIYDADTCPHPQNARRAAAWLASDARIGLVNGRRRILNAKENLLTRIVSIEYHALYRVEHYGRPSIGGVSLFYGSNGFFRREALAKLAGFDSSMLVEDIDLGFRLVEAGYKARYDPHLEEFDEAPPHLRAWWRQRSRWARGWIQVVGRHFSRTREMRGFEKWSARFILALVPAPLFVLPVWLSLVPYFLLPEYRELFWRPAVWAVLWSAPIAYFMLGWFHDARRGERRWSDLPIALSVAPMIGYYTLRSLVMWSAFLAHFRKKRMVWVKTERSKRASRLAPR